MHSPWSQAQLYGIVDLGYVAEERVGDVARALIQGGAGLIQLRAKGYQQAQILAWGQVLQPICRAAGVPLVINDFVEIARAVDADGVHLGQEDGPLAVARAQLAPGTIVGRSTHSLAQARAALAEGADYIGFGPLFPTPTKLGRPAIGLAEIQTVQQEVGSQIPIFCIGGIKSDNLREVATAGAQRVVVVSEWLLATDLEEKGHELLRLLPPLS